MDKKEYAISLHNQGYNCAQSVFCAYCDELGLDLNTAYKISEGFGLGMGGLGQTCGALSGLNMIISYDNSDINNKGKTKGMTYKLIHQYGDKFKEVNFALDCTTLKRESKRSCQECIESACDLANQYFDNKK